MKSHNILENRIFVKKWDFLVPHLKAWAISLQGMSGIELFPVRSARNLGGYKNQIN